MESCKSCRWYRLIAPEKSPYAQCRRYPPRWLDQDTCCYPVVTELDGCGEHEKASADTAAAEA